jgi:hypothetical protein
MRHPIDACVALGLWFVVAVAVIPANALAGRQASKSEVFLSLTHIDALPKEKRPEAIDALEAAIKKLPGVELLQPVDRKTGFRPSVVVQFDPAKADVGDLAKAIGAVRTPGAPKDAPAAMLVLGAEVPAELKGRELPSAKKIKGVTTATALANEVWVVLDEKGGARLSEIKAGLAGVKIVVKDRK